MKRKGTVLPSKLLPTTPDTDWFAKLRSEKINREVDTDFCSWLEEKPENEQEYERCELIWELSEELAEAEEMQSYIEECDALIESRRESVKSRQSNKLIAWLTKPVATAAAVAVVGIATAMLTFLLMPESYETAIGEQRLVRLSDGSTVNLNTNTEIIVDYGDKVRRIKLERGEALFSVAHNPSRPFDVVAGNGVTRAIGTSFNVALEKDKVTISVLEGVVEVDADLTQVEDNEPLPRLDRGKAINYWRSGAIAEVYVADLKRIESWREGKLNFDATRLADVILEHNKYTTNRIVIGDDRLEEVLISGVFRINDTEALLFALEQTFGIRALSRGNYILLTR